MFERQKSLVFQIVLCLTLFVAIAGFVALLPPIPPPQSANKTTPNNLNTYQAKVISITDGDTIILRADNTNVKVRLAQIDAPELGQPWGQKSRQVLSGLVAGKTVSVTPTGQDRYGRAIANINLGERNINKDMVAKGAAWAYRDYLRDTHFLVLEADAHDQRIGLWALSEADRQAPWDYRAQRRHAPIVVVGR
jgi:endonuclease YncB( thermonuclease family)